MNKISAENLKELINSIKAGERIVLFPPGIFSLVSIIILLILSTVTFVGSVTSIFASTAEPSFKAGIQFASLFTLFLFVILPALLIFQGKKYFSILTFYYAVTISLASVFLISIRITGLISLDFSYYPLIASFLSALVSIIFLRSAPFSLLKEFYYLLKS